jgi:hypothetical protein
MMMLLLLLVVTAVLLLLLLPPLLWRARVDLLTASTGTDSLLPLLALVLLSLLPARSAAAIACDGVRNCPATELLV